MFHTPLHTTAAGITRVVTGRAGGYDNSAIERAELAIAASVRRRVIVQTRIGARTILQDNRPGRWFDRSHLKGDTVRDLLADCERRIATFIAEHKSGVRRFSVGLSTLHALDQCRLALRWMRRFGEAR